MTIKARNDGYVSVRQNPRGGGMMYYAACRCRCSRSATARPGMAVAQIPDLKQWEVTASVGELDRGHLAVGQKVAVHVVALPCQEFPGKVKNIGGTTGGLWDRRFECRMTTRSFPGAASRHERRTGHHHRVMHDVLWIPGQALFEATAAPSSTCRPARASSRTT